MGPQQSDDNNHIHKNNNDTIIHDTAANANANTNANVNANVDVIAKAGETEKMTTATTKKTNNNNYNNHNINTLTGTNSHYQERKKKVLLYRKCPSCGLDQPPPSQQQEQQEDNDDDSICLILPPWAKRENRHSKWGERLIIPEWEDEEEDEDVESNGNDNDNDNNSSYDDTCRRKESIDYTDKDGNEEFNARDVNDCDDSKDDEQENDRRREGEEVGRMSSSDSSSSNGRRRRLSRYRDLNGWRGNDLIHSTASPVRIIDYHANYSPPENQGVGTTLTGIVHFTKHAESHRGYCHGGAACSVMDDVIGWIGFLVTGECIPWSGYTVQINTRLCKPIIVNAVLLVQAEIVKREKRKVYVNAKIVDPGHPTEREEEEEEVDAGSTDYGTGGNDENIAGTVHATAEGLFLLDKSLCSSLASSSSS